MVYYACMLRQTGITHVPIAIGKMITNCSASLLMLILFFASFKMSCKSIKIKGFTKLKCINSRQTAQAGNIKSK